MSSNQNNKTSNENKNENKNKKYWKDGDINRTPTICMRKFHNFIKSLLFEKYVSPDNNKVLELAAGRGYDLFKHKNVGVKYTLYANKDPDAIKEAKDNYQQKLKNKDFQVDFLEVDLANNKSKELKAVANKAGIPQFDIVSIQFALHYFLKDKKTWESFFKNIDILLKPGGYVLITTLDGVKVHDLLSNLKKGETLELKGSVNTNKNTNKNNFTPIVAAYKKNYDQNEDLKDLGQEIEAYIQSIGQFHTEYLVNYDFIKKYFTDKNYEVVEDRPFSNLLRQFWKKKKCRLSPAELNNSILHRYLVLQKKK